MMPAPLALTALGLLAYLIGSVPFSFLLAKAWGVDLRTVGSGNIGATNVARSCGPVAGTLAYVLDIGKGFLAVWALWFLAPQTNLPSWGADPMSGALLPLALLPIAGHMYPVWLKFKGGKGVATSAGVFLYLLPVPLLTVLVVFLAVFLISRIISLASLTAALCLPIFVALQHHLGNRLPAHLQWQSPVQKAWPTVALFLCVGVSAFIIYKHRSNIKRLMKGEEHRFGKKEKEAPRN